MKRLAPAAAAVALMLLGGCTAMQQLAALRDVTFTFDRMSGVQLAGIPITESSRWSSLSVTDVARLGVAAAGGHMPIQLTAHVRAANPADNPVAAQLLRLQWKLFVEDRQTLTGVVADPVSIAPGATADVAVAMGFDLLELGDRGARDLYDLGLGIAGFGGTRRELRLELVPTVETRLGPIAYPAPITIRR